MELLPKTLEFQDLKIINDQNPSSQICFAIIYAITLKIMEEKDNEDLPYYKAYFDTLNEIKLEKSDEIIKNNLEVLITRKDFGTFKKKINDPDSKLANLFKKFYRLDSCNSLKKISQKFNMGIKIIEFNRSEGVNPILEMEENWNFLQKINITIFNLSESGERFFSWQETSIINELFLTIKERKLFKEFDFRASQNEVYIREVRKAMEKF